MGQVNLAVHGFEQVKLYVLLTEAGCLGDWYRTAEDILAGGAQAIQLREKHVDDRELLERATRLRSICDRHGALLIINDRADIAGAAAHGVHLGQDDLSVAEARRIVGPNSIIGLSTHTLEQAKAALEDPPEYLAVGPMFPSTTKPQDHIAGPATLNAVREITSLPLVAIGGITADNAAELGAADALAVCSAVIGAEDVTSAVRELLAATGAARC